MATEETKGPDPEQTTTEEPTPEAAAGTIQKLSKRGEDALTRFLDELGKNPRVSDALGKASAAKGNADIAARRAVGQVGAASAEQLEELRGQIEKLEARLAKLEGGSRRKTPSPAEGEAEEATPSPPPGRSIGGGTSRGSGAGGGSSAG
jgi:hypothetical protein